jgi:ABC-type multidrug transport system ATPase subunit
MGLKMNDEIRINKIQLNNFRFFIDDEDNNTFELDGKNMLVYGENGSGKSSIFKAFEMLSKIGNMDISNEFNENKNIFKNDLDSFINFEFTNNEILEINDDSDINDSIGFINNLSVFMPILSYQKLLDISYEVKQRDNPKNLYDFFETILSKFPIGDSKILQDLKDDKDKRYPDEFEKILNKDLIESINIFLNEFNQGFKLEKIEFNAYFSIINLDIEYFDNPIKKYQNFLNEARLSTLAISIYFAIIKKQFSLLENDALKILVLDDLLISLDMNNRLSLIDILKNEFSDFQIFFFTHDKGLFESFKDKMSWKSFEIYVEKNDGYETPFIKKSKNLLEQAKYHYLKYEYKCSANIARQYLEKLLCILIPPSQLVNKNCKDLDLSAIMDRGISLEESKKSPNQDIINGIKKLKTYTRIILNPNSHNEDINIYKKEIGDVIEVLKILNKNINKHNKK